MLGHQGQIVQQRFHSRVEPVLLFQLKRQTFFQRPCHNAGWLKALTHIQNAQHAFWLNAQRLGGLLDIAAHIAAIVGLFDELGRN